MGSSEFIKRLIVERLGEDEILGIVKVSDDFSDVMWRDGCIFLI